ncbi:MAG TPA: hypothetical protein P5081_13525 [Phycisphaerae bacterium]|nr:hypothetical protein [Phycisphaerae bacterium]HRW53897.1 hypothetical protein [Phycisphaerae bacterium]
MATWARRILLTIILVTLVGYGVRAAGLVPFVALDSASVYLVDGAILLTVDDFFEAAPPPYIGLADRLPMPLMSTGWFAPPVIEYPCYMLPYWCILVVAVPTWFILHRRARELRLRERRGLCLTCGYSLVGNVSGACPECGTETPRPSIGKDTP